MDISWIKSPTGRRVLEHWADPRPSWLWSADGQTLLWRNTAARFLRGRPRKRDAGRHAEATPIKGQIARLIRLGSVNRASLSRMQFLVGERPISATCACTPLSLPDGQAALLVVDVDPIDIDHLDKQPARDAMLEGLFPADSDYLLIDDDSHIAGGSPQGLARYAPQFESEGLPDLDGEDGGSIEIDGRQVGLTRFKASPQDASLLLFEPSRQGPSIAEPASAEPEAIEAEPLLPMGLPPATPAAPAPTEEWIEPPAARGGLTSLFDRLMDDDALFTPLAPDEDFVGPAVAERSPAVEDVAIVEEVPAVEETPAIEEAPAIEAVDAEAPPSPEVEKPVLYRIVGRGFTSAATADVEAAPPDVFAPEPVAPDTPTASVEEPAPADAEAVQPSVVAIDSANETAVAPNAGESDPPLVPVLAEPAPPIEAAPDEAEPAPPAEDVSAPADIEAVERVSRYNFDELSRILNDRVGNGDSESARVTPFNPRPPSPSLPSTTPEGALVTLGGETLVLNRLPLGILVFRDQQVLFANRAITEMTGYDSVESLRHAGLAAIFPAAGSEAQEAGPVNHIVQRDGTLVPVTARLQSVSWQGRPALMLSASATEVRTGHEAAVRAFAEHLAANRADGFIETARSGVLTQVSADARLILKRGEEQLLGRPISALAAPGEIPALREFLERPARFAETARPAITLKGAERGIEIMLFAQGQAGIISGYFGFVRRSDGGGLPALAAPTGDVDPALLARLSRGVRRPLNTVIGFSDLIGSAAFGEIENQRYLEYARDIKTAGLEIAALVDELDDFARLRDGRYTARPTDIDLAVLLDSSIMRVRGQANAARVLVRSGISETLPRIRADRASLAQAILNLLASAIDQTPQDGSVVLSAQVDDAGGIAINVRNSAQNFADLGERFVVFRDGTGRGGEVLTPVRSSVGLALTRALLAVNQATLTVDPAAGAGTLFSLSIPAENVVQVRELPAGPSPGPGQ